MPGVTSCCHRKDVRAHAARGSMLAAALLALPLPAQARELLVAGRDPALVEAVLERLDDPSARPAIEVHGSVRAKLNARRAEAQALAEEARRAYGQGDVEGASQTIRHAIEAYEETFPVLEDFEPLARAYLLRADLALAREDTAIAEDCFLVAARYLGTVELDPTTNSPLVIEGYQAARELIDNSPTGELSVKAVLAGLEVWIDGAAKGSPPVKVSLSPGPHVVQARLEGYEPWAQVVPIDPGGSHEVEVLLDRLGPLDQALYTLSARDVGALRALDPDRDWLIVLREGERLRYAMLLLEQKDIYSQPVTLDELPDALREDGWEPTRVDWGLVGLVGAGVGGGVAALSLVSALTLDGVMSFTDLGSGDERATMQLSERILLGATALGLVAGAAGAGLWAYLERDALFGQAEESEQPAAAAQQAPAAAAAEGTEGQAGAAPPAAGSEAAAEEEQEDTAAAPEDLLDAMGADSTAPPAEKGGEK